MEGSFSTTDWLLRASAGDAAAVQQVFVMVYDELRAMAHRQLRREATGHTLATTDLVHEAYLRLVDQNRVQWRGRVHFLAIAATAMRRILVDHARAHLTAKRGSARRRVPLDAVDLPADERADLILAVDEALHRLQALDDRQARVVECRFFGGMTEAETAEAIGIGLRTAKRDWSRARTWLYAELHPEAGSHPEPP